MPNTYVDFMPYDQQMAELQRRQRMAELMAQQAVAPIEMPQSGRLVAPVSPVAGLAKALQGYMANKIQRDVETKRGAAEEQARTGAMDWFDKFNQGKAAPMSPDQALEASLSSTPTEPQRAPFTPTERNAELMRGAMGANPYTAKLAGALMAQKPATAPVKEVEPDKYTPESIMRFTQSAQSGNPDYSLLVPKPEKTAAEPADIQAYKFAQGQGFKGTFLDYQTAVRKAGATNVTTSYGAPVSGLDENGKPVFFQPSRTGGTPSVIPGVRPEGKPKPEPTQGEKQDAYNVQRIVKAAQRISDATAQSPSAIQPSITESFAGVVGAKPAVQSGARQIVSGAQADMLDAMLYLATGATYTKEQMDAARAAYLPGPLDKKETLEAKQKALFDLVEAGKARAGRGWTPEAERAFKKAFNLPDQNGNATPFVLSPEVEAKLDKYAPKGN